MGDVGEAFKAWDKYKKEKKRNNLRSSTEILDHLGINYESKNGGIHLIVHGNSGIVDFWPSTGKYIPRYSGKAGRGVKNLINEVT